MCGVIMCCDIYPTYRTSIGHIKDIAISDNIKDIKDIKDIIGYDLPLASYVTSFSYDKTAYKSILSLVFLLFYIIGYILSY